MGFLLKMLKNYRLQLQLSEVSAPLLRKQVQQYANKLTKD